MKKLFKEFTSDQLARLKKEYDPLKGKTLSTDQWKRMEAMLAKYPTPMLVKIAKADIPMLATAAKSELVIKRKTHKWSDFRRPMDMGESLQVMEEITEACWVGYKQVGMKDKGGRQVPNCVKEELSEADLSKAQIKQVHKKADDLPKNDFIKRYGKDGDSVRYAVATNQTKKKLGIGEDMNYVGQNVSQKLSYDNWLKKEKGIEKGAHGIKGDEHTKYSKEWQKYKKEEVKEDFKAGDKVKYVGDNPRYKDKTGTISHIATGKGPYNHLVTGIIKGSLAIAVNPKDLVKEEVELEEGRMKELHTLIQQGKSAEEIAKIMGVDVKTIKSLMPKEEVKEDFTKKDFKNNERENDHSGNATAVVNKFGTDKEKDKIADINKRHMKANSISRADQTERDAIVNKYYGKLKEDSGEKRIAIDTVKNPNKSLLGGPSAKEAERTLKTKFGYSDKDIANLKPTDSGLQKYDTTKEQRAHTSPEVAAALRQYATQRPIEFAKKMAYLRPYNQDDKRANFEILKDLALKDMKHFNIKFKSMDTDSKNSVRQALAKKGLSSHITDETKPKGDQTMNESYKDKFNATMKKFGINSLDDLKSDEEKKKFFKAVDDSHDAKNEEVLDEKLSAKDLELVKVHNYVTIKGRQYVISKLLPNNKIKISDKAGNFHTFNINDIDSVEDWKASNKITREDYKVKLDKHNCEKDHPDQSHDEWEKDQEKTEMKDLEPDAQKLNAMVKDPHKSKEDKAKKDMISAHSDSDVRPDVKNGGGVDMSKVNDKPKIQAALKKISASYESKKYHDTKPGSIQDAIIQMQVDEYKMITVEDKKLDDMIKTYLAKGGTITKLPPSLQKGDKPSDMKKHKIGDKGVVKSMKMKEVREFITTYNSHFLTNYKAEEFIVRDRLEG